MEYHRTNENISICFARDIYKTSIVKLFQYPTEMEIEYSLKQLSYTESEVLRAEFH